MKNLFKYGLSIMALLVMSACTFFGVYDFFTPEGVAIAATVGVVPVTDFKLFIDVASTYTAFGCAQSAQWSKSREMDSITCKESGNDEEVTPGRKSGTISVSNFFAFDHTLGAEDMIDAFENGTKLMARATTAEQGDMHLQTDCYVESYSINSDGTSGPVTYDLTLRMTGPTTKGTNA